MVCLPDGVWPGCFSPVHQVVAFAVGFAALMSKSEQPAWNFTHEVIDRSISGHGLSRCLGKFPHLPVNRLDRKRRSLERQSLNRGLDFWRYDPSAAAVFTCFSHKR